MNEAFRKLLSNKWLLAITAIGILLLIFANGSLGGGASPGGSGATPVVAAVPGSTSKAAVASGSAIHDSALQTAMTYEAFYNRELERMIDQIAGISDALVMVTVDSTSVVRYGQNVTTSRQTTVQNGSGNQSTTTSQSTSSQIVTVPQQNGNQSPVVIEQQLPHISGVLVVARAADPVRMQAEIIGAVQDALGIPGYEITVLPRK